MALLNDEDGSSSAAILARALIAAKLNAAAGFDPGDAQATIRAADELLATLPARLPQHIDPATWNGQGMLWVASALDAYNNRCAHDSTGAVLGSSVPPQQLPSTGNNPIMDERLRLSVITLVIVVLVALVLRGVVRDLRD